MTNSITVVSGSLAQVSQQKGITLAESFLECDVVILVDTSGSMNTHDSRGGHTRYEIAIDELQKLQKNMPGKIAVISFSSQAEFNPAGIAQYQGGGTDVARALKFVKVADQIQGMKFILVSDGQPDDEREALNVARTFKNHISCIFVGPEDIPSGREFLERLAAASGGKMMTADRAKELAASVTTLLLKG